ncbi:23S rRNA m(5)U-1939 methyltransferase [Psychromonas ingrahamii 37]|uniref:23S rRNA (uracil(1939)-C(5))-methyltransferase RlmD n=1 Tax=Psychromonas ingrahamii (strain DSM 17664 / CCUG 51855 / 37) TaxID=357804 RepID=RLMD_PSYIN|nr:23S rRNA (uracil(1939)-C(5))-methyltransferase RlmD [Psychromonas ingrahamii]A1SSB8.1 RecName: Full=23S rRNA (uracil(1939)-C(5))-methyltransferase RlmD; AltName: Full=23S rRNA(m5U1939)-methyltransferase [Psychromonas ingrahamii 37]ABM02383.1 23S rRNA m(5)U-1939 methyltransferase [Psychromonas ingrahamii 37]
MAQFFKAAPTNSIKNHILKNIKVEKLDHRGRGLAYFQNKPLFIDGALAGELLEVQIVESKKRYSKGKIKKIIKASELRITAACPHYQECGGCDLQHLNQAAQIQIKSDGLLSLFQRFAKKVPQQLEKPIIDKAWEYRRTARFGLQFDKKNKQLKMGLRRAQSNELIDQKVCPVLLPELECLIPPLKILLNSLQCKAHLGHVELLYADQGAVVLLRHMKTLTSPDLQLITAFSALQKVNFFGQASSNQSVCLAGEANLSYRLPEWDCSLSFTPTDFLQVNSDINKKMVSQAMQWLALEKNDSVLDLFCGLGNFTLPIARQVESVVGIEGVQQMVDRATANAQLNNLQNARFYQADLSGENLIEQEWANQNFNKVLLDPARAGALDCLAFIAQKKPSHILYVSCDPLTLARDSQVLLDKGYKLDKLGLLDMFPQTAHMESMALFTG